MRSFIKIISESEAAKVYHGSSGPDLATYYPFFVSRDIDVAAGYARDRGGVVFEFDYLPTKTGNFSDINRIGSRLGLDVDSSMTYELISPNVNPDSEMVIRALVAEGFDSVEFWDFAIDEDFKEVPAIAILTQGVITNPRKLDNI